MQDLQLHQSYMILIADMLDKGYGSRVQTERQAGKTWYIPYHGVSNPAKPGKVRWVFDRSWLGGTSLNKQLITRPDLNNQLVEVFD